MVQLECAFHTLLLDSGADVPLPGSPRTNEIIARRTARVKAEAGAALQQMAVARAALVTACDRK